LSISRKTIGRYGGLRSWANTVDRAARTAPGRLRSPSSIEYHFDRLDPERFAGATDAQKLAAAQAARKAYYAELAMRSAVARRSRRARVDSGGGAA